MKLIKIFTEACGQCKALDRNLKNAGVLYTSINADDEEHSSMLDKYNVEQVPTLLLLEDDGSLIKKNVGVLSVNGIKEFVR